MFRYLKKLFKSQVVEPTEPEPEPKPLTFEMEEFVKERLLNKSRAEIDNFMYDEHQVLYDVEPYDDISEISYILKQTSDKYKYAYQAPEVKVYLSRVICKCLFLKKKKISPEHWLSYINLQ